MARWYKSVLALSVIALFLFAASGAGAQQSFSNPNPVGQVRIAFKTGRAGAGWEWGRGVLLFNGKKYAFGIKGLQVGAVRNTVAHVKGDVYNLSDVGDFAGHYLPARTGNAMFAFNNTKDVSILLTGTEEGLPLNVGLNGFYLKLERGPR
ncbi:MAG: hypothetical protein ACLP7A_10065 [Desulfobaccales bacterium]